MGLDMYAFTTTTPPATAVDFKPGEVAELHYWRKHPDLHGWMRALYFDKGGAERVFNCAPVVLDVDDLDRLEADVRGGRLPQTSGFFFGRSDGTEIEDDLAFIAKARQAIGQGLTVLYDSWW